MRITTKGFSLTRVKKGKSGVDVEYKSRPQSKGNDERCWTFENASDMIEKEYAVMMP